MTLSDYKFQDGSDEGDLPVTKTALTHRYNDLKIR